MTTGRRRQTPEQIVPTFGISDRMLADIGDVAVACREFGVSERSYYRWRNRYGGLKAEDAKRLKEPEKQNAIPKPLLPKAALEKAAFIELAE